MNALLETAASNCAVALILAVLVAAVARFRVNPHAVHVLWLMVLVKFFTPPVWRVDLPLPEPVRESALEEVVIAAPPLAMRPLAQSPAPLPPEAVVPAWTWREGLLAVWGIGILAFASVTLLRVLCFRRLLRKAERGPNELEDLAGRLSRRMGVRRCPEILILPVRITPAVWSLFGRPRIVLPEELAREMQPDQMETILAHELAHIRRGDHLVRLLELAVTTVFWWNPIVWWVRKNLRETEEHCCDSLVLEILPDAARRYAIALIETVEFLSKQSGRLPIGATAAKPTVTLKRRIEMLKHGPTNRRLTLRSLSLLLALLIVPMSLAFAQKEVAAATELKTKVYRLGDLDAKKIEKDLRQQVAPKEWENAGGPYSMRRTKTGSLVITASAEHHQQINLMLELLSLERRQEELRARLRKLGGQRPTGISFTYGAMATDGSGIGDGSLFMEERQLEIDKKKADAKLDLNFSGLAIDGTLLASGRDGVIRGWDLADRSCTKCHQAPVHSQLRLRLDPNDAKRKDVELTLEWEHAHCPRTRLQTEHQLQKLNAEKQASEQARKSLEAWIKASEAWKKSKEAKPADDATFLRRIHLDLLGTPPTQKEVEEFLKDDSPNKRRRKVEELLKRLPADSGSAKSSSELQNHIDELIRKKLGDRVTIEQILTKPHSGDSGMLREWQKAVDAQKRQSELEDLDNENRAAEQRDKS